MNYYSTYTHALQINIIFLISLLIHTWYDLSDQACLKHCVCLKYYFNPSICHEGDISYFRLRHIRWNKHTRENMCDHDNNRKMEILFFFFVLFFHFFSRPLIILYQNKNENKKLFNDNNYVLVVILIVDVSMFVGVVAL